MRFVNVLSSVMCTWYISLTCRVGYSVPSPFPPVSYLLCRKVFTLPWASVGPRSSAPSPWSSWLFIMFTFALERLTGTSSSTAINKALNSSSVRYLYRSALLQKKANQKQIRTLDPTSDHIYARMPLSWHSRATDRCSVTRHRGPGKVHTWY